MVVLQLSLVLLSPLYVWKGWETALSQSFLITLYAQINWMGSSLSYMNTKGLELLWKLNLYKSIIFGNNLSHLTSFLCRCKDDKNLAEQFFHNGWLTMLALSLLFYIVNLSIFLNIPLNPSFSLPHYELGKKEKNDCLSSAFLICGFCSHYGAIFILLKIVKASLLCKFCNIKILIWVIYVLKCPYSHTI